MKAPVKGTPVEDVLDSALPGAFRIKGDRIQCNCPCGCGAFLNLPIYPAGSDKERSPSWEWSGSENAPTLRPSIRDVNGCRFHGYLTDGVWSFCSDSGK